VQPSAGGRGGEEEQAEPGRHSGRSKPVASLYPPGAEHRHISEDEQQLEREDGLDKGQRPEVQRRQLERESKDHAGQPSKPDRTAG
jgi:hypothetical protein